MSGTVPLNMPLELRQHLDRQAIYECAARFCRAADRYDKEGFLAAFHPDATIDVGEFCGSPAELWEYTDGLNKKAGNPTCLHYILNFLCDVDGDTAHVEQYWLFVQRKADGTSWSAGGRNAERFERRDGEWKIAMRVNMLEWVGEIPNLPVPLNNPSASANGGPSHSKDDPVYTRPLINKRPRVMPAGV